MNSKIRLLYKEKIQKFRYADVSSFIIKMKENKEGGKKLVIPCVSCGITSDIFY